MSEKAHRRCLDMLAGWMIYAYDGIQAADLQKGVTSFEYETEGDAIAELYQEVGNLDEFVEADVDVVLAQVRLILLKGRR